MTGRIRKREQDPDITRRSRFLLYVASGCSRSSSAGSTASGGGVRPVPESRGEHRLRLRTVRAPRGLILDRKGRAIAETQGSFDLVCSRWTSRTSRRRSASSPRSWSSTSTTTRSSTRSARRSGPTLQQHHRGEDCGSSRSRSSIQPGEPPRLLRPGRGEAELPFGRPSRTSSGTWARRARRRWNGRKTDR